MSHQYPFAPLVEAMGCSENQAIQRLRVSGKSGQLYRREGMSEKVADRMAIRAGLHPYEVWPDMAERVLADAEIACADPKCDQRFIPTRKSHRFCSTRCAHRTHSRERQRERYQTDPEFRELKKARDRVYRAENRRALRITEQVYRDANRAEKAAAQREYYRRNRERVLARQREYDRTVRVARRAEQKQQAA